METLGIPCLITAYRRLDLVAELLKVIGPMGIRSVYLSIDGTKNSVDIESQHFGVDAILNMASELDIDLKVFQRTTNRGLAGSIITSLDWFFSNESFGAVLEEDEIPTASFFQWVTFANGIFQNNDKVLIYAGHQFFPNENSSESVSWANYPVSAAWGTSREKWHILRSLVLADPKGRGHHQSFTCSQYWHGGRLRCEAGLVDSWAIPLAQSMRSSNYMSVIPPFNLTVNIGDDERAIHTSGFLPEYFKTAVEFNNFNELSLDFNEVSLSRNNSLFESIVYNIRFHHFLLPIRVRFQLLVGRFVGRRTYSLKSRVKLAESDLLNPQLFTRNDVK